MNSRVTTLRGTRWLGRLRVVGTAALLGLAATGGTMLSSLGGAEGPAAAAPAPAGPDTCGYPTGAGLSATVFNESTLSRWISVYGSGSSAQVAVFSNDESGILLGVDGAQAFVPTAGVNYTHATNPALGNTAATDASGRLLYPVIYVTDQGTGATGNGSTAGDWQMGGTHPSTTIDDVFGSWSTAVSTPKYKATKPAHKNDWEIGTSSDPINLGANFPTATTFAALGNEGYGVEFRWNVSSLVDNNGQPLQSNHWYRFQVISHDGDQNKAGGDAGEHCWNNFRIPPPDLSITKTADATPVAVNSPIGFTVTVTNAATATESAKNVTLTDPLPAGTGGTWSISPAYGGPGTCGITAGNLSCSFGDLAPGAHATVHVTTTATVAGTYPNTATAHATNSQDVTAMASITVQAPGLNISKVADKPSTVSSGTSVGFTITTGNSGPAKATSVTMSDPLPMGAGLDWSISPAYAGPGTCIINGTAPAQQTLACSFGDMVAGASAAVHVTSATTKATSGTFSNTATANETTVPTTVQSSDSVTVHPPQLSVLKSATASPVSAGSPIGFSIVVSNASGGSVGTATSVTLVDPLPAGTGISWSVSPPYAGPGSCAVNGAAPNQTLNCSFGDMAPGASITVGVASATTMATSGTFANTAVASATNSDPAQGGANVVVQQPSLKVTKVADQASVLVGNQIGFTVTVGNGGPGNAVNVALNDPLPPGTGVNWSLDPASPDAALCSITGAVGAQTLTCPNLGNLAPGDTAVVHVTSPTTGASVGSYPNTATASADNNPPVTGSATITVRANPPPPINPLAQPAIATSATNAALGSAVSDTATLSNTTTAATGTITFSAYGPSDTTCSAAAVFTTTATVKGSGNYGPVSFTPTTAGTYHWIASYGGDGNNLSVSGKCGDTGEASVVSATAPAGSTTTTTTVPPTTTTTAAQPIVAATTVHTGKPWAGSKPYVVGAMVFGGSLVAFGLRQRRRARSAPIS